MEEMEETEANDTEIGVIGRSVEDEASSGRLLDAWIIKKVVLDR